MPCKLFTIISLLNPYPRFYGLYRAHQNTQMATHAFVHIQHRFTFCVQSYSLMASVKAGNIATPAANAIVTHKARILYTVPV